MDVQAVIDWITTSGLRILLIILIAFLVFKILQAIIRPIVVNSVNARGKGRHSDSWFDNRAKTLNSIITTTTAIAIIFAVLSMVLSEIGIDIAPLLAGAGIVGLAIGLGAQTLIKDYLNGLFIMLEDQYNLNDMIQIGQTLGLVEEINLRRTVLRDIDGIVHSIPNGSISIVSNLTRDFARVKLDMPVAYGEDLDHVIEVINRVGNELAQDERFRPFIKTPPQFLRVQDFGASGIDMRILGDTRSMYRWQVTGELRKRLKKAFDEEGIEIPWPHTKLYFSDEQLDKY